MLSPFLFSLYVGELVNMFEENDCKGVYINESTPNISCLLFADDLVTCADTVGRLQHMIDVVALFCKKWDLEVNLSKTKVMVFRKGGPLRINEKWWFGMNTVPRYLKQFTTSMGVPPNHHFSFILKGPPFRKTMTLVLLKLTSRPHC